MESREARIGTSVEVLDEGKRSGKGRGGTIERTYGHPDYLAVDVRFEDGSAELYWYHELQNDGEASLSVRRLDDVSSGMCAAITLATRRTPGG